MARRLLTANTFRPGRSYRVVPTRANGQPAFGMYLADSHNGVYRGHSLLVVTSVGERITVITAFDASLLPRFGLPRALPATDRAAEPRQGDT